MSDTFWSTLPATITALATLVAVLRNSRKTEELHNKVNGKMDRLLDANAVAARAVGDREGNQRAIQDIATIAESVDKIKAATKEGE